MNIWHIHDPWAHSEPLYDWQRRERQMDLERRGGGKVRKEKQAMPSTTWGEEGWGWHSIQDLKAEIWQGSTNGFSVFSYSRPVRFMGSLAPDWPWTQTKLAIIGRVFLPVQFQHTLSHERERYPSTKITNNLQFHHLFQTRSHTMDTLRF